MSHIEVPELPACAEEALHLVMDTGDCAPRCDTAPTEVAKKSCQGCSPHRGGGKQASKHPSNNNDARVPPLELPIGKSPNRAGSTRRHRTGRALRSKSLLGRAPQPLDDRNLCSGVPRARFFVFGNTRKRCSSVAFSHISLEITARACSAAAGHSDSLFGRASKQLCPRNHGSSKRRWIRRHFRVSCRIPFGTALLRTLRCFELCYVRLHRHRQVPYANLVCI